MEKIVYDIAGIAALVGFAFLVSYMGAKFRKWKVRKTEEKISGIGIYYPPKSTSKSTHAIPSHKKNSSSKGNVYPVDTSPPVL